MTENGATVLAVLALGAVAWWVLREGATVNGDWINEAPEPDNAPDWIDYGWQAVDNTQALFESENEMRQNNLRAFLQAIRLGEGTSGPNGYRTLCGGGLFDSYAAHPAALGWRGLPLSDSVCAGAGYGPGCVSTAAGAFQINKPTWNRVSAKLGLTNFDEASQDAAAIELISEKGALGDVLAGRVAEAVGKVRKVWASLPGANYAGQRMVTQSAFNQVYQQAGGVLA